MGMSWIKPAHLFLKPMERGLPSIHRWGGMGPALEPGCSWGLLASHLTVQWSVLAGMDSNTTQAMGAVYTAKELSSTLSEQNRVEQTMKRGSLSWPGHDEVGEDVPPCARLKHSLVPPSFTWRQRWCCAFLGLLRTAHSLQVYFVGLMDSPGPASCFT